MSFNLLPALPALLPIALLFSIILREKKQRDADSKAPFIKKLYRLPGEFAFQKARELSRKGEEKLCATFILAALAFAVILLSPPNLLVTVSLWIGVFLSSAYFIPKLHHCYSEARSWHLGALGERVVGDSLMREFLPMGFHVFHDVPQDEAFTSSPFNYDHILVDHRGVFLIETKTRSKKSKEDQSKITLTVTDETVTFPDGRTDSESIPDLRKNADELGNKLTEQLGSNIPVYPILVYPGWRVAHNSTAPTLLYDPAEIRSKILEKPEKALDENTLKRVANHFRSLVQDIDNQSF